MIPDVDRRALKILFDTYWISTGWRKESTRVTSAEDFMYAKQTGLMFDEVHLSHQEIVKLLVNSVTAVDRRSVVDAFVVSLTSHRLDIRSALGSFAVFQHFPHHIGSEQRVQCPICGEFSGPADKKDLNILNFERFKWGGVRHHQPLYASFDLQLFQQLPRVAPSARDVEVLKRVLKEIEKAPAKTTSATLQKNLGTLFKSNKAERDTVVAIFGFCGILETADHPGFMNGFIRFADRKLPDRHWVDMEYPACWWRRSDGINLKAIEYWFGHLL
jgi:hypothetical protein